jgi:hypothetical protein
VGEGAPSLSSSDVNTIYNTGYTAPATSDTGDTGSIGGAGGTGGSSNYVPSSSDVQAQYSNLGYSAPADSGTTNYTPSSSDVQAQYSNEGYGSAPAQASTSTDWTPSASTLKTAASVAGKLVTALTGKGAGPGSGSGAGAGGENGGLTAITSSGSVGIIALVAVAAFVLLEGN